ncbi:MAG: hypothetical protein LBT14_13340 [Treponema sp.]|jgi:hypothetical protein|nr:hypothetical protein [Treponema sp.]
MKLSNFVLVSAVIAALCLGSCASSPQSGGTSQSGSQPVQQSGSNLYPPEMNDWIAVNGDKVVMGIGVSDLPRTGDALRQARTIAMQDLAGSLQSEIASVTKDFLDNREAAGQTDRVAEFKDAIGIKVQATVENAQTFGPYKLEGDTFIIRYITKESMNASIADVVKETFQEENDQINKMLGIN